ncbi:MAG: hypothetical protein WBS24_09415 [Terriglobales bacterium]
MEHIRVVPYQGKKILSVNFAHCLPAQVEEILRVLPDHVTTQPVKSVLLLVDFTGASFNADAIRTMKETAIFDKPYVKKTAWIGADSLPFSLRGDVSEFSGREFPIFKTLTEAMEWLAQD